MQAALRILAVPFMLLNGLGFAIALIWLVILGEWAQIGYGFAAAIGMPIVFSIVSLPTMLLIGIEARLIERDWRVLAIAVGFIGSIYTHILVMGWILLIFFHFANSATSANVIPVLLWGYGVATGPLAFMAKHETDNPFTSLLMLLAEVAYIGLVIGYAANGLTSSLIFLGILLMASALFGLAPALRLPHPR
jgi:hypothetical protein